MKSYTLKALCAAVIAASMAVPASAQPISPVPSPTQLVSYEASSEDSSVAVTVTDGVMGYTSGEADEEEVESASEPESESGSAAASAEEGTTVSRTGYYPFQIQYDDQNGAPIIIKSFRIPVNVDPSVLVETDWEENGYKYTKTEILMDEPEQVVEEKTIAEPITVTTEDDDEESIRAALEPLMDYNEGGFSGTLTLDYDSISTEATDTESYSYPIRKTIEVNNLADNDYAYLDKDLNGLTLQSAEWELQNAVQRADDLIPGSYTAYATYTGTGYGTRATSYTSTAYYTGTVKKVTDGDMICSIVYRGEGTFPWAGVFAGLGLLALAAAAAVLVMRGIIVIPAMATWKSRRKSDDTKPPVEIP